VIRIGTVPAGIAAGLAAALLLASSAGTVLGELSEARAANARRGAALALPDRPLSPLVPPGLTQNAADFVARVRTLAIQNGVLAEEVEPLPAPPEGLSVLRVRLSGPEKAVVSLADSLERGTPLVRLRRWRLTALADGGVRLEAEAVAPWR
jgi:hypothetical protein